MILLCRRVILAVALTLVFQTKFLTHFMKCLPAAQHFSTRGVMPGVPCCIKTTIKNHSITYNCKDKHRVLREAFY